MNGKRVLLLFIFGIFIPITKGAIPGTFFWKPRLGLDLTVPTTEPTRILEKPSKANIAAGTVVLFEGYQAGLTIISLASGLSLAGPYPYMNPLSAYFNTNSYRWALRYISLLPPWLGGHGGHYCDTLKVWRKRFYYMDEFVPKWLRTVLFFVPKEEWAQLEEEHRKFKKYSEPAFGKHYRYPSKSFKDFASQQMVDSIKDYVSSLSFEMPGPSQEKV